jgi:hypothetical protein
MSGAVRTAWVSGVFADPIGPRCGADTPVLTLAVPATADPIRTDRDRPANSQSPVSTRPATTVAKGAHQFLVVSGTPGTGESGVC